MIPKECKRLAEVDFPIGTVSQCVARENSRRRGNLSSLHLWWAKRPLASCRAILLGLLVPDPCDPLCPQDFRTKARKALENVPGKLGTTDKELRDALIRFIGEIADWDNSTNDTMLMVARELVHSAYPEGPPTVVDPFAGRGSIPVEALRLGAGAFASDLNPIPVLLNKIAIEYIPKYGEELLLSTRKWSTKFEENLESTLSEYYPADSDGATPIAYLWARTIRCEAPKCGAIIPLLNQTLISKRRRVGVVQSIHGSRIELDVQEGDPKLFGQGTVKKW